MSSKSCYNWSTEKWRLKHHVKNCWRENQQSREQKWLKFYCLVAKQCPILLWPHRLACQAPLFMRLFQQEYQSDLLFPSLGDLPDPETKSTSPAWQVDSLPLSQIGNLNSYLDDLKNHFRINWRQECLWRLSDMGMMTLHFLNDICDLQISLFWVLFPISLRDFFALINQPTLPL